MNSIYSLIYQHYPNTVKPLKQHKYKIKKIIGPYHLRILHVYVGKWICSDQLVYIHYIFEKALADLATL